MLLTRLAALVDAVEIEPDLSAFRVAGRAGQPVPPAAEAALGTPVSESPVVAGLLQALYQDFYCRPGGPRSLPATSAAPSAADGDLLPALRAANAGRERWDAGWRVAAVQGDGRVAVRRGDECRQALPGEFVTQDGPGVAPRPDAAVTLRAPSEGVEFQPGFYFAFGETLGPDRPSSPWVRFYWHLKPDGAAPWVAALTRRLNHYLVPFRLKALRWRSFYGRADAGVLFVHRRHYQVAAALAAEAYPELADHLRPGVPLFAKALAPGLGLAEDPGDGQSFGWQRCGLLAAGLLRARREGAEGEATLEVVTRHLEAAGVDLDHPHLCRSRRDLYDVPAGLQEARDAA